MRHVAASKAKALISAAIKVLPDFGGATIASPTGEHSLDTAILLIGLIYRELRTIVCCMQCRIVFDEMHMQALNDEENPIKKGTLASLHSLKGDSSAG